MADSLPEARNRLRRAEAVYQGFTRRRDEARDRLARLRWDVSLLEHELSRAEGEDAEARAEIEAARAAIRAAGGLP